MFEYATGHQAGLSMANKDNQSAIQSDKNENSYSPFQDKHDYFMAK